MQVLAYAGRPDFEMTILLTLAKALFGAQNFVVFNGSPKKSTEPTPVSTFKTIANNILLCKCNPLLKHLIFVIDSG